jgi:adenylate cyclase
VVNQAGDAVLAEFASATQAVVCALEIQHQIGVVERGRPPSQRLAFRIGINLGEVIDEHGDIYGDGVNVAARLETIAEPGGVCISDAVRTAVGNKLALDCQPLGEQTLKNLAEPVRAYRVRSRSVGTPHTTGPEARPALWRWRLATLAVVIGLVGLALVWERRIDSPAQHQSDAPARGQSRGVPVAVTSPDSAPQRHTTIADDAPALAVLAFQNRTGDPKQDYFAEGISEDLIADLSKVPGLTVIARSSSFAYPGDAPAVGDVAAALNARYVVQGSVGRTVDSVQINARLYDVSSDAELWSDTYDVALTQLFAAQARMAGGIAAALKTGSDPTGPDSEPGTADLAAYEAALQGSGIFQRFSRDDTYRSRAFFERAMALDPAYARPVGMLAWSYIFEYNNGWSPTPDQTLTRALELANQAVALDSSLAVAYFVRGLVYRERKAYLAALADAQSALDLDPNYANAHILLATILYYTGHAEEGLRLVRRASRLNPQHPSNYPFHEGQALFVLKRYPEAIDAFKDGLRQNPTSERLRVWLAAAYARAGLEGEAVWEVTQVLADDPDFSLQRVAGIFPFQDPAELQHFLAALEAAGFE